MKVILDIWRIRRSSDRLLLWNKNILLSLELAPPHPLLVHIGTVHKASACHMGKTMSEEREIGSLAFIRFVGGGGGGGG
jgi:hypothetical protein